MQILLEQTDETHPMTVAEMIAALAQRGISAERKSIYDDLDALRKFGLDVAQIKSDKTGYFVASREFELPELKLLVDSVQSSRFITHKKTLSLIKKIERLASAYEAQLLQRQVYVQNRVKAMNESVYYNVDEVSAGINNDRKIRFHYFDYTINKERFFRHNSAYYEVSPFAMIWDNDSYYLIAFDSAAEIIKHYRVDKMVNISATDLPREGHAAFAALDIAAYTGKVFKMWGGEECRVKLRVRNDLVGAIIDRFGKAIPILSDGADHFITYITVVSSPQFLAWVFAFGDGISIEGPSEVVAAMQAHLEAVSKLYQ